MPLDRLTDEHRRTMAALAAQWTERVARADRAEAERGVAELYRIKGLEPPTVVWCDSPLAGALAAHRLRYGSAVLERAGHAEAARTWAGLGSLPPTVEYGPRADPLAGPTRYQHLEHGDVAEPVLQDALVTAATLVTDPPWASSWVEQLFLSWEGTHLSHLFDRVRADAHHALARGLDPLFDDGQRAAVHSVLTAEGGGSPSAEWSAVRGAVRRPRSPVLVLAALLLRDLTGQAAVDGLDALALCAPAVGWWWAFEHVALLTPPPAEVHTDADGRPHRADGPAVRFADGFSVYMWHAHRVPPDLIDPGWSAADIVGASDTAIRERVDAALGPGALVLDCLAADQRRCAAERLGWARLVTELGLAPVAGPVPAPGSPDATLALYDLPTALFGRAGRVVVRSGGADDGTARLVPTDAEDPVAAAEWLTGPAEEPPLLRRARRDPDLAGHLARFDMEIDDDAEPVEEVGLIGGRRLEPFASEGAGGTYFLCGGGPRRPVLFADSEGGCRVLGRDLEEALEVLAAEAAEEPYLGEDEKEDLAEAVEALGLTPPDTPEACAEREAPARAMAVALTLVMKAEGNAYRYLGS